MNFVSPLFSYQPQGQMSIIEIKSMQIETTEQLQYLPNSIYLPKTDGFLLSCTLRSNWWCNRTWSHQTKLEKFEPLFRQNFVERTKKRIQFDTMEWFLLQWTAPHIWRSKINWPKTIPVNIQDFSKCLETVLLMWKK